MTGQDEVGALPGRAEGTAQPGAAGKILWSFGGILAALAAASCCVVPFGLFVAGISGAWIGNLTGLKAYQPIFVGVALACLGGGFYAVYRKPAQADCAEGSYCARPVSDRIAKIGLWVATVLVGVAVGFPYAARFFLDA
ncbi:MAG TPA: mercuric transporter MerT family protein [Methylomirabilota bacterium]|nr:mercuric transporter MerT family protein [Methylomirabilota bacterium]